MKIETTISLESELWHELNRLLTGNGHRSLANLIEELLRRQLDKMRPAATDESELAKINANADRLNQEAEDVLDYSTEDPLLQLAGIIESEITDVSERHDEQLGQRLVSSKPVLCET